MGADAGLLSKAPRIEVRIDRRFCGPPTSGNGGYVAGLLARELGSSNCEVTLKLPPPLDRDLIVDSGGEITVLKDGDTIIAIASRAQIDVDVPVPPALDEAQEAALRFTGRQGHIFPTCFVCGPDRAEGDGLRIFPGALQDRARQVAASWRPDPSLLDAGGNLRPEFVWAALDCPGYFAVEEAARPAVLGRFGVVMFEPKIEARPLVVTGWPIRGEGRKHEAGTALHDRDGRLLAAARATWITLSR